MFTLLERFGVLTTVASDRMRLISAMRASIMPLLVFGVVVLGVLGDVAELCERP